MLVVGVMSTSMIHINRKFKKNKYNAGTLHQVPNPIKKYFEIIMDERLELAAGKKE